MVLCTLQVVWIDGSVDFTRGVNSTRSSTNCIDGSVGLISGTNRSVNYTIGANGSVGSTSSMNGSANSARGWMILWALQVIYMVLWALQRISLCFRTICEQVCEMYKHKYKDYRVCVWMGFISNLSSPALTLTLTDHTPSIKIQLPGSHPLTRFITPTLTGPPVTSMWNV